MRFERNVNTWMRCYVEGWCHLAQWNRNHTSPWEFQSADWVSIPGYSRCKNTQPTKLLANPRIRSTCSWLWSQRDSSIGRLTVFRLSYTALGRRFLCNLWHYSVLSRSYWRQKPCWLARYHHPNSHLDWFKLRIRSLHCLYRGLELRSERLPDHKRFLFLKWRLWTALRVWIHAPNQCWFHWAFVCRWESLCVYAGCVQD